MKRILQYLSGLEANNNREWYNAHKEQYQEANAEFERLIGQLINSIGNFDSSVILNNPKELTFKLGRDTRFSHDFFVVTAGKADNYNSMVGSGGGFGVLFGKPTAWCILLGTRHTLE
jgi:hypothetical protein